jgi:hypothetical protein
VDSAADRPLPWIGLAACRCEQMQGKLDLTPSLEMGMGPKEADCVGTDGAPGLRLLECLESCVRLAPLTINEGRRTGRMLQAPLEFLAHRPRQALPACRTGRKKAGIL